MAHAKRRSVTHTMEKDSKIILNQLFPKEWVIHDYSPDYGIDNVVELFELIENNDGLSETIGNLFFIQLKSVKKFKPKKIIVKSRMNVEKQCINSICNARIEEKEIEVIKFQIETSELLTVQSIGSGIAVLLVVVTLDTKQAFFVCLNDYIDKIILPEDPEFADKESKVIYIPTKNVILNQVGYLRPLYLYSARSKLYAAFVKFEYQRNEISYILNRHELEYDDIKNSIMHFILIIKRYDIWSLAKFWPILFHYEYQINMLEDSFHQPDKDVAKYFIDKTMVLNSGSEQYIDVLFIHQIQLLWDGLASLSHVHEEICREWYLPTYFNTL